MNTNQTNAEIATKGGVGMFASFSAWFLAHVQEINAFLQTGCLALGFTISAVTLWKLLFKKRKTKHHEN